MKLVKYNNTNDYVPATWNSVLDNFLNFDFEGGRLEKFRPSVDILENEKSFEIHLAVPGMEKEDFNLDLKDNHLIINGERKIREEKNGQNIHRMETQYGSFSRSFRLPENIDVEKISAQYIDGILEIELPKDEKKERKTTIKIK